MEERFFSSASEIENCLSGFGKEFLFRGQVGHFTTGSGDISIVSSQGRKGCVPALLFKWTYYASEILRILSGDPAAEIESNLAQAVLQHYGWRSFFVDLTSRYDVATWFASHLWSAKRHLTITEDYSETPLFTVHEVADYYPAVEYGHVYVISLEELARAGVDCFDLCEAIPTDFRARFRSQKAWLAGPLSNAQSLPPKCISAHLTAPVAALATLAANHGISSVEDLFPSREEDLVLDLLLRAPRRSLMTGNPLEAYYPELLVPEYDYRVIKPIPPEFALYEEFWLADDRDRPEGFDFSPMRDTLFVRVPEHVLYVGNSWNGEAKFPLVLEKLREFQSIAIEAGGIAKVLPSGEGYDYNKGLYLRLVSPTLVEVSELIVEHPGTTLMGVGINQGWYYRVGDDGAWVREERDGQCPCNNVARHLRHLRSLLWVEEEMFARLRARDVREKDISFLEPKAPISVSQV